MIEAVLFDLDGTLADTAPDLGGALNRLLIEEGIPALPLDRLRPYTSLGVRGLLGEGFGVVAGHPDYERLSTRFLDLYAERICAETCLFDGILQLLDDLEAASIGWGIVTNKRTRFTLPVVTALGLASRTPCVVSGDTTPEAKPSPLPVLHACRLLGCDPRNTLFVGDDRRDVEAGKAAGTRTAVVSYGYLGDGGPPHTWQADLIVDHPAQLLAHILEPRHCSGSSR